MYACIYVCVYTEPYKTRNENEALACQYMLVAIDIGNTVLLLSTLAVLVRDEYVFL